MGNICTKGVEPEENEETEDMEQSSKKSVAQRRGKLTLVILIMDQWVQKRNISPNQFIFNPAGEKCGSLYKLTKCADFCTKFNRGN